MEITDSTVAGGVGMANTMSILRSSVGRANATSLTVTGSTLSGVQALTLVITDSTVANGSGPGISASSGTVSGTTVTGNKGSGIAGGQLTLANSTIAGNGSATLQKGGGIFFTGPGPTTIVNSTVTANTSWDSGAGVTNWQNGTLVFRNSIVAGNNSLSTTPYDDTSGPITQQLSSIIAIPAAAVPGILDPAGLADHGGPTKTIALVDSPSNAALDQGDAATCAAAPVNSVDQRGLPRTPPCHIGAFELQP